MGAWGSGAFENDAALDWLAELEGEGVTAVRDVLSRVAIAAAADYLDLDDGSAALAAAEIVAAALGRGRDRVTEEVVSWLDENAADFGAEDAVLARRAVERVLAGQSELASLWGEGGEGSEWHENVRLLLARLTAA